MFKDIFQDPDSKLTFVSSVTATIDTKNDEPVYTKTYPYPYGLKKEIDRQFKKMLDDDVISPSKSPYNSPMWVVNKKLDASGQRKYRLVIDYEALNSKTKTDSYQVPEVSVVLAHLKNNKYFTTLDLASGFHQIPLHKKDREKTAFSVNNGKYQFNRMPMGLKNSPAIFQRVIDDVLRAHIGITCYVYSDDIIVMGKDLQDHAKNLKTIFSALEKANFKIQPDKSEFFKQEVAFLGFTVSQDGIKPSMDKIAAISEYPEPTHLRELRSFLGL